MGFDKLKKFLHSNGNNQVKKWLREWEKVFGNETSNRRLTLEYTKNYEKLRNHKRNHTAQYVLIEWQFPKDEK